MKSVSLLLLFGGALATHQWTSCLNNVGVGATIVNDRTVTGLTKEHRAAEISVCNDSTGVVKGLSVKAGIWDDATKAFTSMIDLN